MCVQAARVHAPGNTGAGVPTIVQESKVGRGGGGGQGLWLLEAAC